MNIEGFSLPLDGDIPIVIGTVPFRTSTSDQNSVMRNLSTFEGLNSDDLPLSLPADDPLDDRCPAYMREKEF